MLTIMAVVMIGVALIAAKLISIMLNKAEQYDAISNNELKVY